MLATAGIVVLSAHRLELAPLEERANLGFLQVVEGHAALRHFFELLYAPVGAHQAGRGMPAGREQEVPDLVADGISEHAGDVLAPLNRESNHVGVEDVRGDGALGCAALRRSHDVPAEALCAL